jgi:TP901 family phage tail tape measure protein
MAMNIDTVLRIVAKVSGTENLNKLETAILGAEKAAKDARSAFTSVTSSATWQAAAVGAAALGAGLAVSVRTGVEFEKAMSGVAAKVGGTSEEVGELNELAQDLGRKTQFSAKEAAEGMDFLAMAGFKTNEIVAAMPGLLDLAAAGELELGKAADITSNILGGMNMEASETGRVADVLAKAATSSNVSVEMLGETFKVVAPVAAQSGVSLEELAAAAGVLGDAGIQGSEAGTGLRSVLLRLAAPPKEAADALDRLGIATKDSAGNMRPFGDILSDVDRRMKELNLGSGDQLEIQNALYGKTAIASGAILQQAAASGTLTEKLKELIEAQGYGAKTAETMNDNVAGAFKRLQSAIEGFQIALTSGANPALQGVIDGLAGLINVVTDVMKQFPLLSTAVLALSAAFIGLVAVAPFIAAFISIIGSLKAALAVGSIGAAWAGIQTVIIVAVAGMKTALLGFLTWVGGTLVSGLLAFFSGPAGWITLAVIAVGLLVVKFREPIMKFLSWLGGEFEKAMQALGKILYDFFVQPWIDLWNNVLRGPVTAIWEWMKGVLTTAFTALYAIAWQLWVQPWINLWNKVLRGPVTAAWEWIKTQFTAIGNGFNTYVTDPIRNAWTAVTTFLPNAFKAAGAAIKNIWDGIINGIRSVFNGFLQSIANKINGVANRINGLIAQFNKLPGPDISPVPILNIPQFATGGFVRRPTMALIGEGGEPEYVVPQSKVASFANNIVAGRTGQAALKPQSWTDQMRVGHLAPKRGFTSNLEVLAALRRQGISASFSPGQGIIVNRRERLPSSSAGQGSGRFTMAQGASRATPAAPEAPIEINVQTGPIMEFNGQKFVSYDDLERAMRATADGVIGRLRTPAARQALGR